MNMVICIREAEINNDNIIGNFMPAYLRCSLEISSGPGDLPEGNFKMISIISWACTTISLEDRI